MKKRLLIVVACVLALLSFAALATACSEKTDVSVLAAASEGDVRRGEFFAVTEGTDMIVKGEYHGAKNLIFENTDFRIGLYVFYKKRQNSAFFSDG